MQSTLHLHHRERNMALSTLSGSSILIFLLLFVAAIAAQRSSKEHIVMPTFANEKIETQATGDCTIEIRIATGDDGTDGTVDVRVYDAQSSSFLDFSNLDNPGVDDFEALQIDTFTFPNKPCFQNVCAATVNCSAKAFWSFESVGVKVKDSDGAVISEFFGVYGKRLSGSTMRTGLPSKAVVGSCA